MPQADSQRRLQAPGLTTHFIRCVVQRPVIVRPFGHVIQEGADLMDATLASLLVGDESQHHVEHRPLVVDERQAPQGPLSRKIRVTGGNSRTVPRPADVRGPVLFHGPQLFQVVASLVSIRSEACNSRVHNDTVGWIKAFQAPHPVIESLRVFERDGEARHRRRFPDGEFDLIGPTLKSPEDLSMIGQAGSCLRLQLCGQLVREMHGPAFRTFGIQQGHFVQDCFSFRPAPLLQYEKLLPESAWKWNPVLGVCAHSPQATVSVIQAIAGQVLHANGGIGEVQRQLKAPCVLAIPIGKEDHLLVPAKYVARRLGIGPSETKTQSQLGLARQHHPRPIGEPDLFPRHGIRRMDVEFAGSGPGIGRKSEGRETGQACDNRHRRGCRQHPARGTRRRWDSREYDPETLRSVPQDVVQKVLRWAGVPHGAAGLA